MYLHGAHVFTTKLSKAPDIPMAGRIAAPMSAPIPIIISERQKLCASIPRFVNRQQSVSLRDLAGELAIVPHNGNNISGAVLLLQNHDGQSLNQILARLSTIRCPLLLPIMVNVFRGQFRD
jgi:hypothetical protein